MLIIVDIPTGENFADIDTRPNEEISVAEKAFRSKASAYRTAQAFEIWKKTGKTFFHRSELLVFVEDGSESENEA